MQAQRLAARPVHPKHVFEEGVEAAVRSFHSFAHGLEVARVDPHQHPDGGIADRAVARPHRTGPSRNPRFDVPGSVGQEEVGHRIVRVDAERMVEQRDRHPGPVLARQAVHQAGAVALGKNVEIAPHHPQHRGTGREIGVDPRHRPVGPGFVEHAVGGLKVWRKVGRFAVVDVHLGSEPG